MSIHRDASPGYASSDFAWEVGFALLLAADHGFGAASVNYGGPPAPDAETFLSRACPIVGSYGGKDPWNRSVAQKLEETLAGTGIAHDVKEYPEAGHSFLNRSSWSTVPVM